MSILVGTTKKIAVINEQPDETYHVAQPIWHVPIIRVGSNGGKLSQPGTNGMAIRWNMGRGDMRLNNRNGTWSGNVITKYGPAAQTGDVSPAGLMGSKFKKTWDTNTYSWASNIGTVNGSKDQGIPDYIRLPKDFGTHTQDMLVIDMYVAASATGTEYSAGEFFEFGILYSAGGTLSTSNTWYRKAIDGSKMIVRQVGNVGTARWIGSVSKGELSAAIAGANNYVWVVPFINDNGGVFYASSEYVTDIMIGIKLKS